MKEMYSIDARHLIIQKSNGHRLEHNASNKLYRPLNEYDLPNKGTYSEDGELINQGDQNDYDWQMALKLQKISPVYKIDELLTHHYDRTPDKKLFLKHIRYHILGFLGEPKPVRKEVILKWIDQEEKNLVKAQVVRQMRDSDSIPKELKTKFREYYHDRASEICNLLIEKYNKDEEKFPSMNESQMIECKLESIKPRIKELHTKFSQIDISTVKSYDNETIFLFGYLMFRDKLTAKFDELRKLSEKSETTRSYYTHREKVLKHNFLVQAGLENEITAKAMKKISSKRYEAFLSLTPNSKTKQYRQPTKKELESVVKMLNDSPQAQTLAIKALKSLK